MNPHIGDRKYLVTGASGYVGGRLVRALIEDKENVRILVRDKNKIMGQPWATQVDICEGSAENFSDLQMSLEGIHTAFYLLHSINLGPNFDEIEKIVSSSKRHKSSKRRKTSARMVKAS